MEGGEGGEGPPQLPVAATKVGSASDADVSETVVASEALAGPTGELVGAGRLESLAEHMTSRLPALPEHRLAASSVLLLLLAVIVTALLVLALRRPTLRGRHKFGGSWTPVPADSFATSQLSPSAKPSAAAAEPSALKLAPHERGESSYNTFSSIEDDAAWQAAKSEWHAAIAAARRLHVDPQQPPGSDPTGPGPAN
jgi:hypothetical protein